MGKIQKSGSPGPSFEVIPFRNQGQFKGLKKNAKKFAKNLLKKFPKICWGIAPEPKDVQEKGEHILKVHEMGNTVDPPLDPKLLQTKKL